MSMLRADSPSILAIIVSWNSAEWLIPCVQGLLAQTNGVVQILIWDNASGTPTLAVLDRIRVRFPAVRIVQSESNLGFAGGNNAAASLVPDTDYILTVNPDAVLDRDCVGHLLEAAQSEPHCGAFGVTQLTPDRSRFDGLEDCYNAFGIAWRSMHGRPVCALGSDLRPILSPCAAVALYRRSAFDACGGFDEDFFCYLEDVDLGFRLQLASWHCLHVPDARAIHCGASATGQRSDFSAYHGHRNMIWVFCKNMPGVLFWLFLPLHLVANLASIAVLVARGQPGVAYRAKIDALRGLPAMLGKRRAIQRRRKVSLLTILQKLTFKLQAGQLFR